MAANAFRRAGYDAYNMTGGLAGMGRAGLAARTRRWACGGSLIVALLAPGGR